MGETIAKIKVSSINNGKSKELDVLVDTGATYTSLPIDVLEFLNIKAIDKIQIEVADGRVLERELGEAVIEIEGKKRTTPVIFGEANDAVVVGVVALESCGLAVDPINKKLIPITKIHHY